VDLVADLAVALLEAADLAADLAAADFQEVVLVAAGKDELSQLYFI
jgi:uncharacterized protein